MHLNHSGGNSGTAKHIVLCLCLCDLCHSTMAGIGGDMRRNQIPCQILPLPRLSAKRGQNQFAGRPRPALMGLRPGDPVLGAAAPPLSLSMFVVGSPQVQVGQRGMPPRQHPSPPHASCHDEERDFGIVEPPLFQFFFPFFQTWIAGWSLHHQNILPSEMPPTFHGEAIWIQQAGRFVQLGDANLCP